MDGFSIEQIDRTCYANLEETHRGIMTDAIPQTDKNSFAGLNTGPVDLSPPGDGLGQARGGSGTQEYNSPDCS
ncbi:MAG: hypothetical protein DCC65_16355 [Planctomycetota bacterium]|nr:MAG: hypothetical protein DCC65_16355 [Planctomycetota bacterium]